MALETLLRVSEYIRRLRNFESRINTTFFVIKIKHLLTVYGIIEL